MPDCSRRSVPLGCIKAGSGDHGADRVQKGGGILIGKTNSTGGGGGVVVGTTAPTNTKVLWIDTGNGGIAKYYKGTAWVPVASVWG